MHGSKRAASRICTSLPGFAHVRRAMRPVFDRVAAYVAAGPLAAQAGGPAAFIAFGRTGAATPVGARAVVGLSSVLSEDRCCSPLVSSIGVRSRVPIS